MGRHTSITVVRPVSEINLTPLLDLTFILLITFIITFPLIEQGIPVNLPTGQADPVAPEEARSITLDVTGALYLDDQPITHERLASEMQRLQQAAPDTSVLVRADREVLYGSLVEVLRILHQARLTRIALVTQADES